MSEFLKRDKDKDKKDNKKKKQNVLSPNCYQSEDYQSGGKKI